MARPKKNDLTCPECDGFGTDVDLDTCFYCLGTGIASEDDFDEPIYRYERF